jgi:transcriptional regulator with XRE-family HTH domain
MATAWKNIKHKFSEDQHKQIKHEAETELKRIGFDKLRLARQQTQVALAERLDIPQNAVSRMERRTDLLLSTLRGYVEGLGGKLELRVVFPDGEFVLESLGPARQKKAATARAEVSLARAA